MEPFCPSQSLNKLLIQVTDNLTINAEYINSVHINVHENAAMTEKYSIADARHNFPALVREAENGKVVGLTRRGKLVAMLIGERLYEQLATSYQGFAESYRNFAVNVNLSNLDIEPDRLFSLSRKEPPERMTEIP